MDRTTIMLPAQLKLRALKCAQAMDISFGELVRESLGTFLRKSGKNSRRDVFFTDSKSCSDDIPRDISINHDDYLYGPGK